LAHEQIYLTFSQKSSFLKSQQRRSAFGLA